MELNILTKENIMSMKADTVIEGYILIRTYQEKPTSNGTSTFLTGTAEGIGAVPFKVWKKKEAFDTMKSTDLSNRICKILGAVSEYNNSISIVIDNIEPYEGDELTFDQFIEKRYDEDELWEKLNKVITSMCTPEAVEVWCAIITPIKDRFRKEYAAVNHHDNCINGLLAHTCKVVRIAQVIKFYPTLQDAVTSDALIIGCAVHDVGKVLEYNNGTVSEQGKLLNHLTLGLGLIMPHKDKIVSLKGQDFYDTLLSVVQQHHGEYGERPKTLAAYLVHLFDMLESRLADASLAVETSLTDTIKCDEFHLRFKKVE
ncbi:MAG: hypothetical protein IKL53_08270 [Lachnospiraceae bacterium]|nr:hypothetical protein [Lachnospiraceae bacterium]